MTENRTRGFFLTHTVGTGALFGCGEAPTTGGGAQITGGGAGLWRAPAQFNLC